MPHLTVAENILLGQMPSSRVPGCVDWTMAYRRAEEILQSIGFVGIDVRSVVRRLSVSHQQMVEIAKAVAVRPQIMILDEPSAVLSQEELDRLFTLVRQLKQDGTLILYISHRLDEVFEIADRITVLKDGQLVGTVQPQEADQNQLIKMMVGRSLGEVFPSRRPPRDEVVLEVKGLGREGSFSDVSFSLQRGEVLGMSGLVGSGRTQVVRCIFGAEPFGSGELFVDGKPVHPRSPREAVKEGIALLTEDRKRDGLVLICSIRDNASMASFERLSRWGVIHRRTARDRSAAEGEGAGHSPAAPRPVGSSTQRWEPAEAGTGEVADDTGQGADPRRTDTRGRCGHQGGDLPAHQ